MEWKVISEMLKCGKHTHLTEVRQAFSQRPAFNCKGGSPTRHMIWGHRCLRQWGRKRWLLKAVTAVTETLYGFGICLLFPPSLFVFLSPPPSLLHTQRFSASSKVRAVGFMFQYCALLCLSFHLLSQLVQLRKALENTVPRLTPVFP